MHRADPVAHSGHDRVPRFFFPIPQAEVDIFREDLMIPDILLKSGEPERRRGTGRALKHVGPCDRPKRKKTGEGIPADIVYP